MINDYAEIGDPIEFGGIVVQTVAMPRRMIRSVPEGEQWYPYKLGYKFVAWEDYTPIRDVYDFLEWELAFEKSVRFLDYHGKVVDVKPNSQWKKKHYTPLKEVLSLQSSQTGLSHFL